MNRLQKKCFFASVAMHSLLVLVLFFGAAFFTPKELRESVHTLTMVPLHPVDSPVQGGGGTPERAVEPPKPAPPIAPPPIVEPPKTVEKPADPPVELPAAKPFVEPPPPRETVVAKPPEPSKKPPKPIDHVVNKKTTTKKAAKTVVEEPEPTTKTAKTTDERVHPKVDLSKQKTVVRDNHEKERLEAKRQQEQEEREAAAAAATYAANAAKARAARAAQIDGALSNIKSGLSSGISIEPVGGGGEAFANYGQVVVSIYQNAWIIPQDVNDDNVIVQVTVTIAKNGRVISASVSRNSSSSTVNKSVRRALDDVKFIAPFPEGATDSQRTFNIDFNLKAKRLRG